MSKIAKRLVLCLSLFVVVLVVCLSTGLAESVLTTKSPAAKKVDEAALIIESQRYKYVQNQRDIFADIFTHITAAPALTQKKSGQPGVTETPKPVDRKTALKEAAQQEAKTIEKSVDAKIKNKQYKEAVDQIDAFGEKYKELGADLKDIADPLLDKRKVAADKLALLGSFSSVVNSIKVLSILRSENHQSAIINAGAFVKKGDLIADFIGKDAPKDLKIVDITSDSIIVGSEELDMNAEIFLDPRDAEKRK